MRDSGRTDLRPESVGFTTILTRLDAGAAHPFWQASPVGNLLPSSRAEHSALRWVLAFLAGLGWTVSI
jgi:hypothetical protein